MTPHDTTLRKRVDELEDENMRLNMRIRALESINADLYEALRDAMRTARKDFATKAEFEAAYPEQVAALAKARGQEQPR